MCLLGGRHVPFMHRKRFDPLQSVLLFLFRLSIDDFDRRDYSNSLPDEIIQAIGRSGERFAFNCLLMEYASDIQSNKKRVIWVNEVQESRLPYDIEVKTLISKDYFEEEKSEFIEVKSTRTRAKAYFEISHNEWRFAQLKVRRSISVCC